MNAKTKEEERDDAWIRHDMTKCVFLNALRAR